ncbi:MAG: hypothetical protein KDB03_01565 [Planctomycetales bacterium]|nr:hypothetical protein [Planctomycetales bacterium]
MRYSIREISILTAFAALLFSKVEFVLVTTSGASFGALLFLLVIFVPTAIQRLAAFNRRFDSVTFVIPFVLWGAAFTFMLCCWFLIPVIFGGNAVQEYFGAAAFAAFTGMAYASVPLLLSLDRRNPRLSDTTLFVGFWSMLAGMLGSTFMFFCIFEMDSMKTDSTFIDAFRVPTAVGMMSSVLTSWAVASRSSQTDFWQTTD